MSNKKEIKILIAVDYDPSAKKVAEKGFEYAKSMIADVVLLHVISDTVYYASPEYSPLTGFTGYENIVNLPLESEDGLRKRAQHFLDQFKLHFGDERTETLITEGEYASEILKAAIAKHTDMIIIGSHSHNWLETILLGSVSSQVVRDSTIPLLIIPVKK